MADHTPLKGGSYDPDVREVSGGSGGFKPLHKILAVFFVALLIIAAILLGVLLTRNPESECPVPAYATVDNVLTCLSYLNEIGNVNGNRAVNQSGYEQSVEFILKQLSETNLKVTRQPFTVSGFVIEGTPALQIDNHSFTLGTDFTVFDGSTSGESLGTKITFVGEGCDASDYKDFPVGNIALVKRGTCAFDVKGANAFNGNASAIIVFNNEPGLLSTRMNAKIPAFSTVDWVGTLINNFLQNSLVSYSVVSTPTNKVTWNIIAETPEGDANHTVIFGSHLDGVPAGNGINDNGSGSCMNLQLALQAAAHCNPKQKIIFAWWGAEEIGLLGSKYYVESLSEGEKANIAFNLNFDMMASPNYVLNIHDGNTAPEAIRNQSILIQEQFEEYFKQNSIPYDLGAFTTGSDYAYFLANGIPAGGLQTGAGGKKTYAQKEKFGGVALVAYDVCYHQKCDTFPQNIDKYALGVNLGASAYVLEKFASDSDLVKKIARRDVTGASAVLNTDKFVRI